MLEAADQPLYLLNTELSTSEVQRNTTAESRLCCGEPFDRGVTFALEQLERLSEKPGGPEEAIGFIREESAVGLPARQGASWNVDEVNQPIDRQ